MELTHTKSSRVLCVEEKSGSSRVARKIHHWHFGGISWSL
jgi:hypothetical protein